MARVLRRDVLPAARWASAAARCDSCRPHRWEIAAAMFLAPTGAAGGRTWYVARALQREARVHGRVAGHQVAVLRDWKGRVGQTGATALDRRLGAWSILRTSKSCFSAVSPARRFE